MLISVYLFLGQILDKGFHHDVGPPYQVPTKVINAH
jgi:hypothetical protein